MTDRQEAEMYKKMYHTVPERYETLARTLTCLAEQAQHDFEHTARETEETYILSPEQQI